MMARINGVLGGVLAGESFTLSQSFYFGKAGTAERYDVIRVSGRCIDVRSDLDATAIGKALTRLWSADVVSNVVVLRAAGRGRQAHQT